MKNIIISMQTVLLSEAIARAFAQTGEFRAQQILPGRVQDTLPLCCAMQADVLLMEAGRLEAYTLERRLALVDAVRRKLPSCRFALLCDEDSDAELARQVKRARQDHQIDAFFYTSVTPDYLTAAVDAL